MSTTSSSSTKTDAAGRFAPKPPLLVRGQHPAMPEGEDEAGHLAATEA
jgi:hypothetical protein